jgi:tRNA A-37 threonylcarbamoyl transferase component Bud32
MRKKTQFEVRDRNVKVDSSMSPRQLVDGQQ